MKSLLRLSLMLALGLGLGLGTAGAVIQEIKRSKFTDEVAKYTIEIPQFVGAGGKPAAPTLIVTGPPENGFAPNLNVTIQEVTITAKDYKELSLKQFEQAKLKVLGSRDLQVSGRDAIEFQYEGSFQAGGNAIHYMTLAVIDKERVVLATCACLPDQVAKLEPEFKAALASLKLP